jgi:hypothetical protein
MNKGRREEGKNKAKDKHGNTEKKDKDFDTDFSLFFKYLEIRMEIS